MNYSINLIYMLQDDMEMTIIETESSDHDDGDIDQVKLIVK